MTTDALPKIIHDPKYKGMWHWESWYPVANDDAPPELKAALEEWKREIEE